MFDFDPGKIIVIGVVALVVIGPKELPRVMRQVGQTVGKLRRMAAEFQSQFMDAMREAEMADVKEEMSKIAETAKIDVAFDPVRQIRNEIGKAIEGEPKTDPVALAAETLPALPSDGIDLGAGTPSHEDPAHGFAPAADTSFLSPGVAPQPEDASVVHTPTGPATLDDVREALSEELASERPHDVAKPLKEHVA